MVGGAGTENRHQQAAIGLRFAARLPRRHKRNQGDAGQNLRPAREKGGQMMEQIVSAENPWPNTETKTVLVCRIPKKDDKPSANEFVNKDGRICRWVVIDKK